jgi:hypothetical protein
MDNRAAETLYAVAVQAFVLTDDERPIVLDDTHGCYWAVNTSTCIVFEALHHEPQSQQDLTITLRATHSPAECQTALQALLDANLVSAYGIDDRPPWRYVLSLVLFNWHARVMLRLRGWRAVNKSRKLRPWRVPQPSLPVLLARRLLAAARLGYLTPGVSPDCVPRSLAMYRLLRHLGYDAEIQVGASALSFEPHMWVSVRNLRIDSGISEPTFSVFRPVPLRQVPTTDG